MKRINPFLALTCGVALMASAQAPLVHAQEDHAAHHAASSASPVPIPAQRWATDAPLREGMGRVRTALDDLRHYEMGHMPVGMALDRVNAIEDATTYMFAHCKLAADADSALHGMLVPLLSAAQRLKKDPQDMAAVAAMRNAVAGYPRYFDDPQWVSEADSEHGKH